MTTLKKDIMESPTFLGNAYLSTPLKMTESKDIKKATFYKESSFNILYVK